MDSEAKQFLFRILNTPSPSGFESEGQKVWMSYVGRFADSVENDAYGTAWATLNGRDPAIRVMLEAHADEIGFMIQNITDEGMLFLNRIGGSDRALARGKRLKILGDQGPVLGVIGSTAIHLRDKEQDKLPEVHELFVDIGANSKAEVERRGIRDDIYPTKRGIPRALVSIPMRYMHSTVETIDFVDVERCVTLLTKFVATVSNANEFIPKLL